MKNVAAVLEFDFVECEIFDDVAVLYVNDPPANTLTYDLVFQLEEMLLKLSHDDNIKALIITGRGDKFFSGGVNIGMLRSASAHFNSDFILYAAEVFERIVESRFLVVAAINGHITGGGLELALIADKRVAVEGNYNFGFPEVNLGVIPGLGGTQRLSKLVGSQVALELITHGDFINIQTAYSIGAVDDVLPNKDFISESLNYTKKLISSFDFCSQVKSESKEWFPPTETIVEYKNSNKVGIIRIKTNSEKYTAMQVLWSLNRAILNARQDQECCALLIQYESVSLMLGSDSNQDPLTLDYANFVYKRIENYPRISAFVVTGCLGVLETELALSCDYRLSKSSKIELILGACLNVQRRGRYKIFDNFDVCKTNKITINCDEEYAVINNIDKYGRVDTFDKWMSTFVPPKGASLAIGYAKLAIVKSNEMPIESGFLLERHLQEQLFRGFDSEEGMRAYMEKRSTKFKGE